MKLFVGCLAALFLATDAQRLHNTAPIRGPVAIRNPGFGGSSAFGSGAFSSGNPCSRDTCGPNTRCEPANGIARCRCLSGFVPDGNTIQGCKYQCTSDNDCDDREYRCQNNKCVRVCEPGTCGLNAECTVSNRRPNCQCPTGYAGDAYGRSGCRVFKPPVREAPLAPPIDPCLGQPCGTNAQCVARGATPVCSCPLEYEGNPLTHCTRSECIESGDCPQHQACSGRRCINPCNLPDMCGLNAECLTRSHQPVCSCGQGMTGDPFTSCRRFRPEEYCNPSPCGANTNCRVRNNRAECSCIENYIGDPLTGCRAECISHRDCAGNQHCRQNRCVNPCAYGSCGEGAHCNVVNNEVRCTCPQFFQGDPRNRCFAECTKHEDCNSNQACIELQCRDPCVGACGLNALCNIESHKPICSCPKDMTGHPFDECRPFTDADFCADSPCGVGAVCNPGVDRAGVKRAVCTCPHGFIGNPLQSCRKGDCERPSDCGPRETCHQFVCQDACVTALGSVCGEYAECRVNQRHEPVCACPQGYVGDPREACRTPTAADFRTGRF